MPPPHALALRHSMPHLDPAHFTLPPQLDAPLHSMEHEPADAHSTPPEQAESTLHFTLQAMPSGHRTRVLHPSFPAQSKTHTSASHLPPSAAQRMSQGAPP
jgi:hypothetical protein